MSSLLVVFFGGWIGELCFVLWVGEECVEVGFYCWSFFCCGFWLVVGRVSGSG